MNKVRSVLYLVIREFDLNVQSILEHWTIADGIREIIANAIDEQALTSTKDIQIIKDDDKWHIIDFGRGIDYKHFTQDENVEKLENYNFVIGKFGVGLKDALATFDRRGIDITISSPHGVFRIRKTSKRDFEDIITLHVTVDTESSLKTDIGTKVTLSGIQDKNMKKALSYFLRFSSLKLLEKTEYGSIYTRTQDEPAKIFVHGVKVAEEDNFMFSYDITSLTAPMRKALNRERTNVGRSAYTDRVKKILLKCTKPQVMEFLSKDLPNLEVGTNRDETNWSEITIHCIKIMSASNDKTVFIAPSDTDTKTRETNIAIHEGYKPIYVPLKIREKLTDVKDIKGNPVTNLDKVIEKYNESFVDKPLDISELSKEEMEVYSYLDEFKKLIPLPPIVKNIKISEELRLSTDSTYGYWDPPTGTIFIRRTQLESLKLFARTYFHELGHAITRAPDSSRLFENGLCNIIGDIIVKIFNQD